MKATDSDSNASKTASPTVVASHHASLNALPFADQDDVINASRGLIATYDPRFIKALDGNTVWDVEAFDFLHGAPPPTVHPSLWRHSQLTNIHGLFEVVPGLYQVRGLDVSVISFIEGDTGVIVVDPLVSVETAAAALGLYRHHRGPRAVSAVLYTHSHVDHFGGVRGILSPAEVDARVIPVIAPAAMSYESVSENVYAGTAMTRRADLMFGRGLPRGPKGHVGVGIGQAASEHGRVSFVQPTLEITADGTITVDGVEFEFQLTPDTEAPAELQFFLPQLGALCVPENATHSQHNLLTPRGALVRDARAWARHLDEAVLRFGSRTEVLFASHHWPTWGRDKAIEFLTHQRDLYAYLHDQTLRMLNAGLTATEIAEAIELPPELESRWYLRGTYGSVVHNVKAIYQRYLGWYDGNPVNLWKLPPREAGRRYVEYMGGADEVVAKAAQSFEDGDYRWVAEVLGHVVFADPDHAAARELLADTLEQLGYLSESGPWRCSYLTAAHELRHGVAGIEESFAKAEMLNQLTPEQWFDTLSVRINGPRAFGEKFSIAITFTDLSLSYRLSVERGVLWYRRGSDEPADLTLRLAFADFSTLLYRQAVGAGLDANGVETSGDVTVLGTLFSLIDTPDRNFAIVTP
ncbi:MAG TPA: alkyl sulfatase dimerization domain-containing protein [Propionicimonas sp.]|nr:alkyl sulfatase dimerization domain-containing protein [Propionicimonas sp.]